MSLEFKYSPYDDPCSYSNHREARVAHYDLDLSADFAAKSLKGHVDLKIERSGDSVTHLVLDARTLSVHAVTDADSGDSLPWEYRGEASDVFGQPLAVQLGAGTKTVRVAYATQPGAMALQWLPPAQTAGKVHPYMLSQCQAIHARSLLPCQDSPGVKSTFTAAVTAPAPLTALVSALADGEPEKSADGKSTTFRYRQPVPMSAYLLSITVGNLARREISPRMDVWSEPEVVDAAAHEFADGEKYLKAAEAVAGPYIWGRSDMIILPPSYPYGGMETPCFMLLTPTLLAGDRSLVFVLAHEQSHSWSGNGLSPRNWESFWCNEGFTVFLERKIMRAVHGAAEQHLHAIIGQRALKESIERYGADHPYTALHIKNDGSVDPDDAFSSVPYEKGFTFLWYLEQTVAGGDEKMNGFLRDYFARFRVGTIDSEQFRAFFCDYFKDSPRLGEVDWDAWLYKPGYPPVVPEFDTSLSRVATELAAAVVAGKAPGATVDGWSANQTVVFLEAVVALVEGDKAVAAAAAPHLDEMDGRVGFTASKNAEIRHRWYQAAIRCGLSRVYPAAAEFISEQGRMKFTRTLYRDLFNGGDEARKIALDTFKATCDALHPICRKMVERDLKLAE